MADKEKQGEETLSLEENVIGRFSNIKDLCDSAIALFSKKESAEEEIGQAAFEITEKIQEEIEEIRDLIWE